MAPPGAGGNSFGGPLDSNMDSMEETRFKKRHQDLFVKLSQSTHFTYLELECLMIMYYKLQKSNRNPHSKTQTKTEHGVTKAQFREILHCALDMTDDHLMDRIFLAVDRGPSIYISMETWANSLSMFLRGTMEEYIDFCFTVYDIMDNGYLSKEGIFHLLKHSMVSPVGEEDAEEAARDMIEVITKKMDIDRDGKISYNDYKTTVMRNPMLLEAFGQCLPSRHAIQAFLTSYTTNTASSM